MKVVLGVVLVILGVSVAAILWDLSRVWRWVFKKPSEPKASKEAIELAVNADSDAPDCCPRLVVARAYSEKEAYDIGIRRLGEALRAVKADAALRFPDDPAHIIRDETPDPPVRPADWLDLSVSGLGPTDDPERYPPFVLCRGPQTRELVEDGLARLRASLAYLQAEYDKNYPPKTMGERLDQIESVLEDV